MSIEKLRSMASKRFQLSELPEKIELCIKNYEFKADSQGREGCFLHLVTRDGEELTQKFTSMHIDDLAEALEKLGFKDGIPAAIGKWLLWEQKTYRIGNPRLIPKKVLK